MGRTKAIYNWHGTGRQVFYDGVSFETLLPLFPVVRFDDFLGLETDATNDWIESDDSGTSAAGGIAAGINGLYQIDTGTDADKYRNLSTPLLFEAAKGCGCEVRLSTTTADAALHAHWGFVDAVTEGTGTIAFSNGSLAAGAIDSVAEDAVMFGVRAETSDDIYACSVIANATPQSTLTPTDIVIDAFHIYRIQLDALGNARYYIDGVLVAEHLLAVTPTDDLCFSVQSLISTGSTANFLNIDYIKIWQNRS